MLDTLGAVNKMLASIGESRVNTVTSGSPDAALALNTLEAQREEVLSIGWFENTIELQEMQPNAITGNISVPNTWFLVEAAGKSKGTVLLSKIDPLDSARKLYNQTDGTFVFTDSVEVRLIHDVTFESLSYPLRSYITARAGRKFQSEAMGSVSLNVFTQESEQEAWERLMSAEADLGNYNILTGSAYMQALTYRNNPLTWR